MRTHYFSPSMCLQQGHLTFNHGKVCCFAPTGLQSPACIRKCPNHLATFWYDPPHKQHFDVRDTVCGKESIQCYGIGREGSCPTVDAYLCLLQIPCCWLLSWPQMIPVYVKIQKNRVGTPLSSSETQEISPDTQKKLPDSQPD